MTQSALIPFHIILSPVRSNDPLVLERDGDCLIFNGTVIDLGTHEPASDHPWIIGPVEKASHAWTLTIRLPHGRDAQHSTRFPEPLCITQNGPVPLPDYGTVFDTQAFVTARQEALQTAGKKMEERKGKCILQTLDTLGERDPDGEKGLYFSQVADPFSHFPTLFSDVPNPGVRAANIIAICSAIEFEIAKLHLLHHSKNAMAVLTFSKKQFKKPRFMPKPTAQLIDLIGIGPVTHEDRKKLALVKDLFDYRHRLAHGIWGVCEHLPGALILADAHEALMAEAALLQLHANAPLQQDIASLFQYVTDPKARDILGRLHSDAEAQVPFQRVGEELGGTFLKNAEIWEKRHFVELEKSARLAQTYVLSIMEPIKRRYLFG